MYISGRAPFAQPVLIWLRDRMHAAVPRVAEAIKWGMPAFLLDDRPFANMAAFKAHATFGFWNRADTTGREDEAMGQFGRIESLADLPDGTTFEAIIRERAAAAPTKRAAKPAKPEAEVPEALAAALADDTVARATFSAFPPSCRREYCDWVAEAKRPETRDGRVAQTIAWLREGKRRNWKYESC
ncbi:YdeI/OmpD-associated family protein [Sphingomonas sp. Leaf33]|uniref:YdeI/OmpD-associated family protein n=1 Tax=Sphingomonas sp. Leaf33 TaxID=1736215 RepID=UPI002285AD28|nr:YdeI/OmpD-associated family protein [Sphingomonas sp. Leaf33]